jgi:hypothetical protein
MHTHTHTHTHTESVPGPPTETTVQVAVYSTSMMQITIDLNLELNLELCPCAFVNIHNSDGSFVNKITPMVGVIQSIGIVDSSINNNHLICGWSVPPRTALNAGIRFNYYFCAVRSEPLRGIGAN